jgi:hypothetical protein
MVIPLVTLRRVCICATMVALLSNTAYASFPYFFTVSETIVFAGDHQQGSLVFAVGSWGSGSEFVPDSLQHSFTVRTLQADPGISLVGASSGTFSGFDSLIFEFDAPTGQLISWPVITLLFQIDSFKADTITYDYEDYQYYPLVIDTPWNPQVEIGATSLFSYSLSSLNALPVELISCEIIGDDSVQIDSSTTLPDTVIDGYYGANVVLRIHAPSQPGTISATLVARVRAGNIIETNNYPIALQAVQFPYNCINGHFDPGPILYPWQRSGQVSMLYHNVQAVPVVIDSASIQTSAPGVFQFDTAQFPITVSSLDSGIFTVQYSLPSDSFPPIVSGILTLYLSGSDTDQIPCPNNSFYVEAPFVDTFLNSGNVLLYPSDSSVITIQGVPQGQAYTVAHLFNNGSSAIKLSNLRISGNDSAYFQIIHSEFPSDSTLSVGASFPVWIEMFAENQEDWTLLPMSNLLVQLSDSSFLEPIRLNGFEFIYYAKVSENPSTAKVSLFPNPVDNDFQVIISPVLSANLTISDALGRLVLGPEQVYDNISFPVKSFLNGIYFVTVHGNDENDNPFILTRRMIVSH